jgi:hypothetical protein
MHDYAGSLHLHSSFSFDGNVHPREMVAAAKKCGLDFIVITDHFRMDAHEDGWDGWHDGVFVLIGEEISPRYNHCLALGISKPIIAWKKSSQPQDYIDAVNAQGGFCLIAHPDHTGAPLFGIKAYTWKDWSVQGIAGISIWDLMTDWQEKLTSIPAALWAYIVPTWFLSGPKPETLKRWDAMNKASFEGGSQHVFAFGEIDNHNSLKKFWNVPFRIFPFHYAFSTVRTHVVLPLELSRDNATARAQLLNAIKAGSSYVSQDKWRDAKGFSLQIYNETANAQIGGELSLAGKPAMLEVKLPSEGTISILRGGTTVHKEKKRHIQLEINEPGVYRVEVFQTMFGLQKPWIFSNPIFVRE